VTFYGAEVVSIGTRLRAGRPEFDSRQEQGYFSLRHPCVQTGSGAQPSSIQWVPGDLFLCRAAGAWSWPLTST